MASTRSIERSPVVGRALVVDDEPDIALTLAEILEHGGMAVDTAENGSAGLEKLRLADYDVVLTDVRMPIMDGLTFYRRAEALKPGLGRRFIFVTGDAVGAMIKTFLDETNSPCVEKPFTPSEILRLVSAMLQGASGNP